MFLAYHLRGLGLPEMPISGTSTPLWEYITTAMRQPYIRQKRSVFPLYPCISDIRKCPSYAQKE